MLKTILKNTCARRTQLAWFSSQNVNKNIENSAFQTKCKPVDLSFETKTMYAAFPSICEEIVDEQLLYHQAYPELRERYSHLLQYTINIDQPRYIGKPIFFLYAYRMLEKPSVLTDDNIKKACVLGWCQRMGDVSIIIEDDVFDKSDLRYGKPAWHAIECTGPNKAILDAAFVESSIWYLLINHFQSHKFFVNILKQVLKELERYNYSARGIGFTSPILRTALYMANIDDKDAHNFSEEISMTLSHFMKFEDDFNGVFNPISDIEKITTDTPEGRPSWLAVQAYQRSSPAQKTILEENYGKANKESVLKCYELFKELKLDEVFMKYKEDLYNHIFLSIHKNTPKELPKELYLNFLNFCMTGAMRV